MQFSECVHTFSMDIELRNDRIPRNPFDRQFLDMGYEAYILFSNARSKTTPTEPILHRIYIGPTIVGPDRLDSFNCSNNHVYISNDNYMQEDESLNYNDSLLQ